MQHLARVAAAITDGPQVVFAGLAAILRVVSKPSPALIARFARLESADVLVFDNDSPQASVELLQQTVGVDSAFHHRYGYCLRPHLSWEPDLATNWHKHLIYVNANLRHGPMVMGLSPVDVVLSNLAANADSLINMELILCGAVDAQDLYSRAEAWTLPAAKRHTVFDRLATLIESVGVLQPDLVRSVWSQQAASSPDSDGKAPEVSNVIPLIGRVLRQG
ncbi:MULTISPECIES: hypothetical protein [Achromobacter]|uniref:hypothetical protein n=1 Tax=Achromobacter TaxID=222 RepID=UPI0023F713F0|nr:hypothetical protein [Achromobacter anxifer]MDF8364676.1 hypothetical protein [Achromobacter anxifer]